MPERPAAGYFHNGMPYNRVGSGARPLVVFQGLVFENKPQSGMMNRMYRFLGRDYTVYSVLRKPGMPQGYTLREMADDYADLIRQELGGPLDVIGVSTGGSIVHYFAADHPELVRRLVIHSSAYALSEPARCLQRQVGHLAAQGRWKDAYSVMMGPMLPRRGLLKHLAGPLFSLGARLMALRAPQFPSDLVTTIETEDQFDFSERLFQITAPTLVIAGEQDPFYTPELFRETAAGIPDARLILYPELGHPAAGRTFERDVLAFLREEAPPGVEEREDAP